jgi:hypothetical protein
MYAVMFDDAVDLLRQLQMLEAHPEFAAELRKRAPERIRSVYSWPKVIDAYEKLFLATASSDHPIEERAGGERLPLLRPASRLLVIDSLDRILLFRVAEDQRRPRPLWITPGGGVHPGESPEDAARRELWEETGIEAEPGPCVWVRRHVFEFKGIWLDEVGSSASICCALLNPRSRPKTSKPMSTHSCQSTAGGASKTFSLHRTGLHRAGSPS